MRMSYLFHTIAVLMLVVSSTLANTFYVSPSGSHNPPFDTLQKAATNIQVAVNIATNAGDVVLVDDGIYYLSSPVSITHAITVKSINGPAAAIVNGSGITYCFNLDDISCIVSGLTITNGFNAGDGGGIMCLGQTPVITNCVVTGNHANSGGGIQGGTIYHSIIRNNIADDQGGGIYGTTDPSVVYDSLISSNVVSNNWGGGVEFCELYNCTVVGNTAPDSGGASDCPVIYNSIVYSNSAPSNPDVFSSTLDSSCIGSVDAGSSGSYIVADPLFVDFVSGDYRLQPDSPCINTGNNSYVVDATDLDGNPRVVGSSVDLGAYEFQVKAVLLSGEWSGSGFVLQWPTNSMYDCQVLWTTNLNVGFTPLGTVYYPQNSYTDTIHSADASGFYKVQLQ